jgi:hypothetical protein
MTYPPVKKNRVTPRVLEIRCVAVEFCRLVGVAGFEPATPSSRTIFISGETQVLGAFTAFKNVNKPGKGG